MCIMYIYKLYNDLLKRRATGNRLLELELSSLMMKEGMIYGENHSYSILYRYCLLRTNNNEFAKF